jgi:hypothetical protein
MAWERNFEKRVLKIREKELKYQKLNYTIEVYFITTTREGFSNSYADPLECYLVMSLYKHPWFYC